MDQFMEDQKQLLKETNRWTQYQKTRYLLMAKEYVYFPLSFFSCLFSHSFFFYSMLTGDEFSPEQIELAQWDDGTKRREQELLEQQEFALEQAEIESELAREAEEQKQRS